MFEINGNKLYIQIGEFREKFQMDLTYWTINDYKKQWSQTCIQIFEKKNSKWAFITNMHNPKNSDFLVLWLIYRCQDNIFIQNQLLFFNTLKDDFDVNNIDAYIEDRLTENGYINDDGIYEEISEWECTLNDIKLFYKSIQ